VQGHAEVAQHVPGRHATEGGNLAVGNRLQTELGRYGIPGLQAHYQRVGQCAVEVEHHGSRAGHHRDTSKRALGLC
jgi:hypothetical protein